MPSTIRRDHLSPRILVFAPIAVLTAIVAGAVFYLGTDVERFVDVYNAKDKAVTAQLAASEE